MIKELTEESLVWLPEKGIGYYPVKEFPYDADYFNKYKGYADTDMGIMITRARSAFVSKYFSGEVLDVGVGCGQFVTSRENTIGYDVNPKAVEWLKGRGIYADLYGKRCFDALTFWDSLEHIKNPRKAIKQAKEWVFVSLPIFADLVDLQNSKHFRKDEHFWYFTHSGLVAWFSDKGFDLEDFNDDEVMLGREGIKTYVFRRREDD